MEPAAQSPANSTPNTRHVAADAKSGSTARNYALDGVLEADPAAGKALIAKLSKDKDEQVKKHAIEAGSPKKN